jgi:uncharacterized membrane protein YhaH (DUF805 family)
MDLTYLFTNVSGRINRTPYWLGILVLVIASLVLTTAAVTTVIGGGFGLFVVIVGLFLLIYAASVPLTVKRLHDRGKSGHYAWLIYVASIAGSFADSATRTGGQMSVAGIVVTLIIIAIGLWFFIELGFLRGTPGPNAYGPDPLEAK